MRRNFILGVFLFVFLNACGGSDTNSNTSTTTEAAEDLQVVTTTQLEPVDQTTITTTTVEEVVATIPTTTVDTSWEGPVYPLTGLPAYEGIPQAPAEAVKVVGG